MSFIDVLFQFLKLKKKISLCGSFFITVGVSNSSGFSVVSGESDSHHESEDNSHAGDAELPLALSVFLCCHGEAAQTVWPPQHLSEVPKSKWDESELIRI